MFPQTNLPQIFHYFHPSSFIFQQQQQQQHQKTIRHKQTEIYYHSFILCGKPDSLISLFLISIDASTAEITILLLVVGWTDFNFALKPKPYLNLSRIQQVSIKTSNQCVSRIWTIITSLNSILLLNSTSKLIVEV